MTLSKMITVRVFRRWVACCTIGGACLLDWFTRGGHAMLLQGRAYNPMPAFSSVLRFPLLIKDNFELPDSGVAAGNVDPDTDPAAKPSTKAESSNSTSQGGSQGTTLRRRKGLAKKDE